MTVDDDGTVSPINNRAWAIGKMQGKRLHVRRIVWGRLLARIEKRPDETIRRAFIKVRSK